MSVNSFGVDESILESNQEDIIRSYAYQYIEENELTIVDDMSDKPWGMGFRFADSDIHEFIENFFPNDHIKVTKDLSLSPKLLFIAPQAKLSWQYHMRRSELWKVIGGMIGVVLSSGDKESAVQQHKLGDLITVEKERRHRIVGLESWGLIAEIWHHTVPSQPSNEEDIVRISDEFGREGTTKKR